MLQGLPAVRSYHEWPSRVFLQGQDKLAKDDRERCQRFLRHLEPLQPALEAYARRNVYDTSRMEDVLQIAISKAFGDFHRYAEGTNFRAWIFRYLNLEIFAGNRDAQRQWRRHVALSEEALLDESWSSEGDSIDWVALIERPGETLMECDESLAAAIHALNPLERSTLLLRSLGELSHHEIAEVLEVPVGTVMSALSRARKRLRDRLANYAIEEGFVRPKPGSRPR